MHVIRKSYLKLEVIWKDDALLELNVSASNGTFSGTTHVYDQSARLSDFTASLTGFPSRDRILSHEAGEKGGYAYFAMKLYSLDKGGLFGVEIHLESNEATDCRSEEKNSVKLEIIAEPAALDNFQRELFHLAEKKDGDAVLHGR